MSSDLQNHLFNGVKRMILNIGDFHPFTFLILDIQKNATRIDIETQKKRHLNRFRKAYSDFCKTIPKSDLIWVHV